MEIYFADILDVIDGNAGAKTTKPILWSNETGQYVFPEQSVNDAPVAQYLTA